MASYVALFSIGPTKIHISFVKNSRKRYAIKTQHLEAAPGKEIVWEGSVFIRNHLCTLEKRCPDCSVVCCKRVGPFGPKIGSSGFLCFSNFGLNMTLQLAAK